MVVIGNKIHWRTIQRYLNLPNFGGRGGRRIMERMAVETKPTMAKVIIVRVINGKLNERMLLLNSDPPTITGNQPSRKIIKALVAQEWNPSIIVNP